MTVPAYALHHMEEYYPDPEKFDPERYGIYQALSKYNANVSLSFVDGAPKTKEITVRTPLWHSEWARATVSACDLLWKN